jgi:uncharacterized protein (UPF0264 family)
MTLADLLGSLSARAARYLGELTDRERALIEREHARRQIGNDILAATIAIKRARADRRPFTLDEARLIAHAERHVRRGTPPPALFAAVGRAGRRKYQTMLSLADPGHGHLRVTLRDADLLDGVVVHHEVIAREAGTTAQTCAPYRMIDIRQNGVIRLHAADDVPVSVYCGRPAYQLPSWRTNASRGWTVKSTYEADPISPCHLAAAAASAAFANGVADVKFNLVGLTVTQAIDLLTRVRRAVDRDEQQTLSTQFSINAEILDDRAVPGGRRRLPRRVSTPAAIAALSVEITRAGGWDRVTLDSASDAVPSTPIIDRLGDDLLRQWVRDAHAERLETYVSGGLSSRHIPAAVDAGVDGIGLGFWIHRRGRAAAVPGTLDKERIREAIRVRNEAEGRGR